MNHLPVALLGGVVYYIDARKRLCSLREGECLVEYGEPLEAAGICAGVGGCGNHRIFIADRATPSLKVFDPLSRRLDTLAILPSEPLGIAKEDCTIVVSLAGALWKFDLKTLEPAGRWPL